LRGSFRQVPKRIVLDVDDTFDAVHGDPVNLQRLSAPTILHPAAAASDPLANNNRCSYCLFNTQYMLFPRA
jgi:hypothetical protein